MRTRTELQMISVKSGRKVTECRCKECKNQCRRMCCLGTPADIMRILQAGYKDRIIFTQWAVGVLMGTMKNFVNMYQAEFIKGYGCTFFKDGLCELHDRGLKPTEGKLSHHGSYDDETNYKKTAANIIAMTWCRPENFYLIQEIKSIIQGKEKS